MSNIRYVINSNKEDGNKMWKLLIEYAKGTNLVGKESRELFRLNIEKMKNFQQELRPDTQIGETVA